MLDFDILSGMSYLDKVNYLIDNSNHRWIEEGEFLNIGIDIDLVVCPSDEWWWEDLVKLYHKDGVPKSLKEPPDSYDYTKFFPGVDKEVAMDFWRKKDLYDNRQPFKEAVRTINHWANDCGHNIHFISTLKGDHHKSKFQFIEKHFSYTSFLGTKEKWVMSPALDIMIDDRESNLAPFDDSVVKILFPARHNGGFEIYKNADSFWKVLESKVNRQEYNF